MSRVVKSIRYKCHFLLSEDRNAIVKCQNSQSIDQNVTLTYEFTILELRSLFIAKFQIQQIMIFLKMHI